MNSEEKFEDMKGARGGVNMAYADKGVFGLGGKGRAIRKEKRYLKGLAKDGDLNQTQQERLDYLKKMQGHRTAKIGAGLAAGAAIGFGGAALAGSLGGSAATTTAAATGAGATGTGAATGTAAAKGGAGLFGKLFKGAKRASEAKNIYKNLTPEQIAAEEQALENDLMNYAQGGRLGVDPRERQLAMLRAYMGARIRR